MVAAASTWLLVAGFFGAGLFNAVGTPATRADFARWGYPPWWHGFTGGLEILVGVLIAIPGSRHAGLALGALVIAAAILTVLRHREFPHLVPLGAFAAVIALAAIPFGGGPP